MYTPLAAVADGVGVAMEDLSSDLAASRSAWHCLYCIATANRPIRRPCNFCKICSRKRCEYCKTCMAGEACGWTQKPLEAATSETWQDMQVRYAANSWPLYAMNWTDVEQYLPVDDVLGCGTVSMSKGCSLAVGDALNGLAWPDRTRHTRSYHTVLHLTGSRWGCNVSDV